MANLFLRGGHKLAGRVRMSGAKNAVLPIIAATLLTDDEVTIFDAPDLNDVRVILSIIESMGRKADFSHNTIRMKAGSLQNSEPDAEMVKKMRASILLAGSVLAKTGRVRVALPGGCAIGARPIDLHLKGFKLLGAEVIMDDDAVEIRADKLKGNHIYLDFPSVGATENILIAATLAEGVTVIENAAKEPEIIDLADFLNKMGADIRGAGSDVITIYGKERLYGGVSHKIISDRIEAGTFMVAAAITGGEILIENVILDHLTPLIAKLREMGVSFEERGDAVLVKGSDKLSPVNVKTLPYPGYPTDMQAQMMAILSVVPGSSIITETIFENRLMHAEELKKMGAKIEVVKQQALITGVEKLRGAKVRATDLRAGAALILAGLVAEGETEIFDTYHIDRGYEHIEEKFRSLGADIWRGTDEF